MRRPHRYALWPLLALIVLFAGPVDAQSRGALAVAPGASMQCIDVVISIPPAQTIRASDAGNGVVDLDIFVLAASGTPHMSVTRSGRDLHLTLDAPPGMMACTIRAQLTGVPAGTYDLHLERRPVTGDLARTTVTVR